MNGTRIHYVEGGKGTPVLLLPGWPQTWWEFRKIMPELAKRHRVIAVDLRGMGGSAKPGLGYDKKNMAKDIHELTQALGYKQVNIAGHDIGAMVAYSFAANYPDVTLKICLIDVAHPGRESLHTLAAPATRTICGPRNRGNQPIRSISGGSLSINCRIFRNNCWLGSPGLLIDYSSSILNCEIPRRSRSGIVRSTPPRTRSRMRSALETAGIRRLGRTSLTPNATAR